MTSDMTDKEAHVRQQLISAISNGFDCHVCNSTHFSINGMGLVICEECAIIYHIHALKKIYKI